MLTSAGPTPAAHDRATADTPAPLPPPQHRRAAGTSGVITRSGRDLPCHTWATRLLPATRPRRRERISPRSDSLPRPPPPLPSSSTRSAPWRPAATPPSASSSAPTRPSGPGHSPTSTAWGLGRGSDEGRHRTRGSLYTWSVYMHVHGGDGPRPRRRSASTSTHTNASRASRSRPSRSARPSSAWSASPTDLEAWFSAMERSAMSRGAAAALTERFTGRARPLRRVGGANR